ncbi:hypothetical protein ACHIPZ_00695 [Antrihabitans sp. NCIMB 15449]|uniref:Guanylate cyclase n=1 Tax=Antrihabitans spumae TaxID=3373370 RepID=A0ABW7JGA7_9NOCA
MTPRMHASQVSLSDTVEQTRTGDIWIFRGHSGPDRAIRTLTNSPVNHVGMSVVLADLPPLIWHAELGKSLQDMWTGRFQRGVQLHDLRDAVQVWGGRYKQRGWLRQLEPAVSKEQEDALLRAIARLDGTPFPSTAKVTGRWFAGRLPGRKADAQKLESAYCAEVVGTTYEAMGLLRKQHRSNWYDPGKFWSGDRLPLATGFDLGRELEVVLTEAELAAGAAPIPTRRSTH